MNIEEENQEKIEKQEVIEDVEKKESENEANEEVEEINIENQNELGLHGIKETFEEDLEISETKFFRGSIRCGTKMEFENSIIIIGDVNAGAEVIAGGNIVVTGFLKGLAHAGAKGNTKAIISARGIENSQIRIANIVKELHNLPEFVDNKDKKQNYAYVKNNTIIIE